jgi:hypothetical protein
MVDSWEAASAGTIRVFVPQSKEILELRLANKYHVGNSLETGTASNIAFLCLMIDSGPNERRSALAGCSRARQVNNVPED